MKETTPGKRIVSSALNMTALDYFAIWRAYRYDEKFQKKYPDFYKDIKNYGIQYIPRIIKENHPKLKWKEIVKNAPKSKYLEVASRKRKETAHEKDMRENYFISSFYNGIHGPQKIDGVKAEDYKRWTEAWDTKGREYTIKLIFSDLKTKYKSLCKTAIKYSVEKLKHDFGMNAFYETMEEIYRGQYDSRYGLGGLPKSPSKTPKAKAKVKSKKK